MTERLPRQRWRVRQLTKERLPPPNCVGRKLAHSNLTASPVVRGKSLG
jgi:hypothetical protein